MSEKKERKIQKEEWYDYDKNGNLIHRKDSDGYEEWCEYDKNGNLIHTKNSKGFETWYKYDKNGNLIHRIAVI